MWVREQMSIGGTIDYIVVAGGKMIPPLTRAQVMGHWQAVREEERLQLDANLPSEKAAQLLELRYEIMQMKLQNPKPWASITRQRRLIAEMTGTLAPVEVDFTVGVNVDVRIQSAVMTVIGGMTADQIDELAREQLDLERQLEERNGKH